MTAESARSRVDRQRAATPERLGRRRLPASERAARLIEEASRLFAEQGWSATTRTLARRLGVTQALLYKYFPSKEALIEAVFAARADRRCGAIRPELLADRNQPLEARLVRFYDAYLEQLDGQALRLFVRGALDGYQVARRYSVPLTEQVLAPVVVELRAATGIPDLRERSMLRGERELVMMLHGSLMFLAIRKFVYDMPMPDSLGDLVALQVRSFLPGALTEMRRLHEEPGRETLRVRQLMPRRRS